MFSCQRETVFNFRLGFAKQLCSTLILQPEWFKGTVVHSPPIRHECLEKRSSTRRFDLGQITDLNAGPVYMRKNNSLARPGAER